MSGALAAFAVLLALGAHVVVPAGLVQGGGESPSAAVTRRRWALTALPLLMVAVAIFLGWLRWHPDPLIALGWGSEPLTTFSGYTAAAMVLMLAVADLFLLLTYRRLEPVTWRLLAGLALPVLLAVSTFLEIIRVGQGPRTTLGALILAALCRAAVALGTGAALEVRSRATSISRIPRTLAWTLPAAALLPLYPLALPGEVRALLLAEGAGLTVGAAAALFLVSPWLPARLRRPALLAAGALGALVFAQATDLAGTFLEHMRPLPGL